jgi:hypothetical protein
MNRTIRTALVIAAAAATLVFANAALAANSATFSVVHTPMVLAGSQSTTISLDLMKTGDPVAAINIYIGPGYAVNLTQAPGTTIGSVTSEALSHVNNLTLPLDGPVVTDAPSKYTSQSTACAKTATSQAVWIMNLSVAGQTIAVPVYVNPTAGAETALGAYKLSVCLPPWDIPESLGGAAQGAQVLTVSFTVEGVFTTPTAGGLLRWDALITPYTPGRGTANLAGTFETRAFVPLPVLLGVNAKYKSKKARTYTVSGKATAGGVPLAGVKLSVLRGTSAKSLARAGAATTGASGAYASSGKLKAKKTTYFQVSGTAPARDYTATGCASPLTSVAPAGCVSATLSRVSLKSVVVKLNK